MSTPRTEPPHEAGERATLAGFLDYQRDTLAMKCAGLTATQLRERAVPPSDLSLLGLVRHMAEMERGWFREVLNGEQPPPLWGAAGDFAIEGADVDEAFDAWHTSCAESRSIVDRLASLEVLGRNGDDTFSARWIMTHMVEEYARHNGHADLLRERLDGVTGE